MIYDTVKTEEKARELVNEYVSDNNLTAGYFENSSVQCECGETQAITWYNGEVLIIVGICDCCGDDDAFVSEVLNVR